MSEQLPPLDVELRRQLARRSAGAMPSGLLTETLARLDEQPAPGRWAWSPFRAPRTMAALGSLAVVAILAVALVFVPSIRNGPSARFAGYPADRALTTAELAELLAGPALPVNTALVASVTIDVGAICPRTNQYLMGVVQGISPAVCVEERRAVDYLGRPMSGTYAFRYLGPGDLGLVGKITPASSSRLAFQAGGSWPQVGAFLVEGWLGQYPHSCPAAPSPAPGDPLSPTGVDPCTNSWVTDSTSPVPTPAGEMAPPPGNGLFVEAFGARIFDSIPDDPTKGVYVITRDQSDPADASLRWLVLAKLADLSAEATPTPSPTSHQLAGYPADRALTTAELADLMSGPTLATNTTFVASVTIDKNMDVCPMNRAPTIGVLEGMRSQVCVMGGGVSDYLKTDKASGTFVFQYWAPGVLALIGEVTPASSSQLAFHVADTLPTRGKVLLDAWIGRTSLVGDNPAGCPAQTPDASGNVECSIYWVSDTDRDTSAWRIEVQIPEGSWAPQLGHGIVLVSASECQTSSGSGDTCVELHLETRLADDPFASIAQPTPIAPTSPTSPATPQPPSPTPLILPTSPAGAQPPGLWGNGDRPLTVAEFPRIWASDPGHLANRIVIVKGPVPAGFSCWSAGQADAGISPPPCHIAVEPSQIAADGHYWAVKVGGDGKLKVLGEIQVSHAGFVFTPITLPQAGPDGLFVVDGYIRAVARDCTVTDAQASPCGPWTVLSDRPADINPQSPVGLEGDAYATLAGKPADPAAAPIHGLFLVRAEAGKFTLLVQLSTVQP